MITRTHPNPNMNRRQLVWLGVLDIAEGVSLILTLGHYKLDLSFGYIGKSIQKSLRKELES